MRRSLTARKHGWGRDHYRWVSGLTAEEREAVKNGQLVCFKIPNRHPSQSGYKVVTYYDGYDCREPSPVELQQIRKEEKWQSGQS